MIRKYLKTFFCLLLFSCLSFNRNISKKSQEYIDSHVEYEVNIPQTYYLSLEEAINRAISSSRALTSPLEAVIKADLSLSYVEKDFELRFLPKVEAGYAGGGHLGSGASFGVGFDAKQKFRQGTQITAGPSIYKVGRHWRTVAKAVVTQPLLRGFGKEYNLTPLHAAEFASRTAYRALYTAEIQLILKTIQAVYEIIKQEELMKLYENSLNRLQGFAKVAKIKQKIGFSDSLNVYRAEIELKNAEEAFFNAQERYQDAKDALKDLLSIPLASEVTVSAPLTFDEHVPLLEEAIAFAFENRIEIQQAEDKLQESLRLCRIAKKNLLPELNLVMNYSSCGEDQLFVPCLTRRRETTWDIGFSSTTDLEMYNERQAFDLSLIAVESSQRNVDLVKESIALEVKRALRILAKSMKKISVQEQQIKNAEGEFALAQIKFNRGRANNFDLIQAEKTLQVARSNLLSAVIERICGEYQMRASLGTLADKPQI